jgi:polysaccharide export outer membrane protein
MRNRGILGLVTATMFFVSGAHAQDGTSKATTDTKPASSKDNNGGTPSDVPAPRPATDNPNYLIGPDDELNVSIWREPDISRSVPVRPDGKISLPLVNDVQAVGLTPMQLGAEITTRLKKFIADPQVTIIVTRINSQRIFILGEVPRAGAYPMLPNMTVLEALSLAGGVTAFAKQSKIHILRMEDGKQLNLPFNYKEALHGQHSEQNIILKPGDTIVVP